MRPPKQTGNRKHVGVDVLIDGPKIYWVPSAVFYCIMASQQKSDPTGPAGLLGRSRLAEPKVLPLSRSAFDKEPFHPD